jgi:uncharacterized spore protein YtfJ
MEATMFDELVGGVRDLVTAKRVYGDWYEKDGLTVIPAAIVRGGGGGGAGEQGDRESGRGGGFGVSARPAGAWVIDGHKVRWQPAIDPSAMIRGAQMFALTALLVRGVLLRGHRRRERRSARRSLRLR